MFDEIDFAGYALPLEMLALPHVREIVSQARLIWGFDQGQAQPALFYGKSFLEDVASGRESEFDLRLAFVTPDNHSRPDWNELQVPLAVIFAVDLHSEEADTLAEIVHELRGESDWQRSVPGERPPSFDEPDESST